jgi:CIC family chloride channel protein
MKNYLRNIQVKSLRFLYKTEIPSEFYLLFLALMIGVLTGFGAYFLNLIVEGIRWLMYEQAGNQLISSSIMNYLRIIFPAIGGLLVGLMIHHFSPEVKGHGIPGVMESVANKGGHIRRRVSILTSLNSGMTIGSGGSAGKEGPIVQIGAAIGSSIGQLFKVSQRRMKILVGCGAAAGLAAVFNAPIAGVVFTIELILGDYSLKAFTPIVVSSVVATAISNYFIDSNPLFHVPVYAIKSPWEFSLFLLMGLLGGVLSVVFIRSLYTIEDFFEEKIKLPNYFKPAIGGLITGIIAFWFPQIYGFNDLATHSALISEPGMLILLVLIFAKILATSFTLGSGGTGGLFTPSLFIGAMFGALFGEIIGSIYPGAVAPPGAYALVGMGIIVAGTIHAPLSALLIIFEVTRDYNIILPLMIGTVSSTLIARWIEKDSIYTMKLSLFTSRIEHGVNIDILQNMKIRPLIHPDDPIVHANTSFNEILNIFINSKNTNFPVVDQNERLIGIITMRDIRPLLSDKDLAPLLLAIDIMSENVFVLSPEDSFDQALRKMEIDDNELLPVVNDTKSMRYLGTVSKDQIQKQYTKKDLILTQTE